MDLYRFGIKLFAAGSPSVQLKGFVPIFHSWIQRQSVAGHQLIDVHDYSHIHHGPGVLLVAHEGNFSTDMDGGRLGLAYFRKLPAAGGGNVLRACLETVKSGATLLEAETSLGGLKFLKDELLVVANDRLLAPNDARTFQELKPALSSAFGEGAEFTQINPGTKERLTVHVRLR
jgi:hypothetical protein